MSVVPLAVDVGQADALVVELVRVVEPRRVVHRHLGAEAAVAEVGPVADLAVADADEVGQAVAATGRRGRSTACRRRRRGAGRSPRRAPAATRRAGPKPSSASEGCQTKASSSVISTSAWPSPSRSTKREVRVAPVAIQARGERAERLPALVLVVLVEAGRRAVRARRRRAGRRRPGP